METNSQADNGALESEIQEEQYVDIDFTKGEILNDTSLEAIEKETKPTPRFDEASFIKELDKQGIGRPSTYATIVQVLLDERRGYCKVEDKKMVPTALGINLSHFLDASFGDIINIKYTAELEKQLDIIAKGDLDSVQFLSAFYGNLQAAINKVAPQENEVRSCPKCRKELKVRKGKYGLFYGCSGYPDCNYIEPIKKR